MIRVSIENDNNEFVLYDNSNGTILRSFEGFEYPTSKNVIEDLPARDGSLYIDSKLRRRRLSVQGDLLGDSVFTLRRNLITPLTAGELLTLKFTTYDDLELQTSVVVDNLVMPYTHQIHRYLLEMIAPDFRFYSQELLSQSTEITSTPGGTPVSAAVPAPVGGGSSLNYLIENLGNYNTLPIFEITGPGTDFNIQNLTNGQSFNLNLTIASGHTVTIDTQNKSVTRSTTNLFGSFDGDFIQLSPGNNILTFNALSGTDSNTQLTTKYRHAYLGV